MDFPAFLRKPRVLLVEDDAAIALLVEQVLIECGCECVGPAAHMRETLRYAKSTDIDAALIDVVIDGNNADEVAETLALRRIPFSFISGLPKGSIAKKWNKIPYIEKPFGEEKIHQMLLTLLARLARKSKLNRGPDRKSVGIP
jgi:two-component SAPR family response regulator